MGNLEDDLMIESSRLIWIQSFVMLLLVILIYNVCILFLRVDLPSSSANRPPFSSPTSLLASDDVRSSSDRLFHSAAPSLSLPLLDSKTVETQSNTRRDEGESSSRKRVIRNESNIEETGIDSATKRIPYHPCQFFGLARQAFLKCLGLDNNNNNNSSPPTKRRHDKDE